MAASQIGQGPLFLLGSRRMRGLKLDPFFRCLVVYGWQCAPELQADDSRRRLLPCEGLELGNLLLRPLLAGISRRFGHSCDLRLVP